MIELNKLKLLAQGGQADIYELDDTKVIRVLRNSKDEKSLKTEMSIMKDLKSKGKAVPEVYEYLKINGRPSIIMERLKGGTMLDEIKKSPLKLLSLAEKLASLQMEVSDYAEGLSIISINERAAYLIPKAKMLDTELKEFVLGILRTMPNGNNICHGDFHPGNIIIADRKYYVIDWFGATSGSKFSDIAHTYLLLKNAPKLPSLSKLHNFIIGFSGKLIAGKYISTCAKLQPFDYSEFSKWMVIRAAERISYGMPTEKETLIKFIGECRKAQVSGIDPSAWWKLI